MSRSDWSVLGLDGDPAPGAPDAVRQLGTTLLDQSTSLGQCVGEIRSMAAAVGSAAMVGAYAAGFRRMLDGVPGELAKLEDAYEQCGRALLTFARRLDEAQTEAASALRNGTAAQESYDASLGQIRTMTGGAWSGHDAVDLSPAVLDAASAHLDAMTRQQIRDAARRALDARDDLAQARRLAATSAALRDGAATTCAAAIETALHSSGIANKSGLEKLWNVVTWPFQSWDHFVSFCSTVGQVAGVLAAFVSGPAGWTLLGVAVAGFAVKTVDGAVKVVQHRESFGTFAFDTVTSMPALKEPGAAAATVRDGANALDKVVQHLFRSRSSFAT